MPYVPSEDRPYLDERVNELAENIIMRLDGKKPSQISELYMVDFMEMSNTIHRRELGINRYGEKKEDIIQSLAENLGYGIFEVAKKYEYPGAWLGELNYSVTTLIQEVPFKMVEKGTWNEALRYWLYAETVGALTRTASKIDKNTANDWIGTGLVGVFEDVRDEYKIRVNQAYEAAQIVKSGDCYDKAPYQSILVKVPWDVNGLSSDEEAFMHILPVSKETVKTAVKNAKGNEALPIYLLEQDPNKFK